MALDPRILDAATEVSRVVWLNYVCTHCAPEDIDPAVLQCVLAEVAYEATEDLKAALCPGYDRQHEKTPHPEGRGSVRQAC